jgi:hypothetical protein
VAALRLVATAVSRTGNDREVISATGKCPDRDKSHLDDRPLPAEHLPPVRPGGEHASGAGQRRLRGVGGKQVRQEWDGTSFPCESIGAEQTEWS